MTEQSSFHMLKPKWLLHAEGGAVLVAAVVFYGHLHGNWTLFALLFLAPDLFMAGYLFNKGFGAMTYNLAHTYTLPLILTTVAWLNGSAACGWVGLIWFAHIGWDRLIGYGLKYENSFKETHLQRV